MMRELKEEPNDPVYEFLRSHKTISGFDSCCPFDRIFAQKQWFKSLVDIASILMETHGLESFIACTHGDSESFSILSFYARDLIKKKGWGLCTQSTHCTRFGDKVDTHRFFLIVTKADPKPKLNIEYPEFMKEGQTGFGDCLRTELNHQKFAKVQTRDIPEINSNADLFKAQELVEISFDDRDTFLKGVLHQSSIGRIFDPNFPAPGNLSSDDSASSFSLFRHSFGVPFTDEIGQKHARSAHPSELLGIFGVEVTEELLNISHGPAYPVSELLQRSCPLKTANYICKEAVGHLFPSIFECSGTFKVEEASCLVTQVKKLPSNQDWLNAYRLDSDTEKMLAHLESNQDKGWPTKIISSVNEVYRPYLRDNRVALQNGRLVAFQKLSSSNRPLALIIVPETLQKIIFDAYHANPSAGHLGEYKTLHRIRLRFLFPNCRSKVKDWIQKCPECILSRSGTKPNSELIYSWPVSSPFFILHIDIWSPGESPSAYGFKYLLVAMCDLTGFVMIAEISDTSAPTLANAFMKHMLLRVGFCGVVVPDAASSFKAEFEEMCSIIDILFHAAARGNHKSVSVERFFRTLNKCMSIACEARGTNKVSVECAHLTGYAWNASTIDGTNIVRSVPALGRPFRFPFDRDIAGESDMFLQQVQSNNPDQRVFALHEFLRLGHSQSKFAIEILRILTEDRRIYHAERINELRQPRVFQVGDVVTVRVQMHSNASEDKVAKISYRRRGPYEIVRADGNGAYIMKKLGATDDSPTVKHMAENLEMLPASILPCNPIDAADMRFLNMNYAPKFDPFKKHFGVEGYNIHWFDENDKPDAKTPPTFDNVISEDFGIEPECNSDTETTSDDSNKSYPVSAFDVPTLRQAIESSVDKLFFIAYRSPNTLRPRWWLVQVDLEQTEKLSTAEKINKTTYYCHFFSPPDNDEKKESHPGCRWWPIWHEYSTDNGMIVLENKCASRLPGYQTLKST
jgi:hypothetical protein